MDSAGTHRAENAAEGGELVLDALLLTGQSGHGELGEVAGSPSGRGTGGDGRGVDVVVHGDAHTRGEAWCGSRSRE